MLDAHAGLKPKPIEKLSAAQARTQPTPADAVNVVLTEKGMSTDPLVLVPGVKHADRTIAGAAGEIPARIYTPDGAGPFPVIVYFHGGGWVIADKQVYDGGARGLSKQANAVVVSVDYRQAPEHRFPAAWDDALAAYQWTLANAASLKGDPKKLALAGERRRQPGSGDGGCRARRQPSGSHACRGRLPRGPDRPGDALVQGPCRRQAA